MQKFSNFILFFIYLFLTNYSLASLKSSIVVKVDNKIITNFEIKNKILSTLIIVEMKLIKKILIV